MALKTYSYSSGSEFANIVRDIMRAGRDDNLRFVVPSRKDKHYWPGHENHNLWTWQDIYDDIAYDHRRHVLSPPDHFLILRDILNYAIRHYSEKAALLPGLKRPGFLSVISDDIRELLNEAVRPEQLINNPESDNPSEFLLYDVYSQYLDYLKTNDLLDSAQVYTAAYDEILENQEWGRDLVMVFAGFMSFNHGQLELVRAIVDRCRDTVIIKPEAYMSGFHDAASQFGIKSSPQKSSGRIIIIPSAEPGLEPEIIARTLSLWQSGEWQNGGEFPGFDAVGLMIDEGRQEQFAEALTRYHIPYGFMKGITINQTLPGKILSSLRHLSMRQFPSYDTAIMLTQPCFAGSGFPVMRAYKAGRSGLERWAEYLSERVNDPEEKLHDAFYSAMLAIEAIGKFCGAMKAGNTPSRIIRAFSEFLNAPGLWLNREDCIADFPEFDETRRITASAIQTVDEKVLALSELLPDLGRVGDEKLSGDAAYDFLEDWCKNSHVRAAIQLSNSVRIFMGQPPVLAFFPVWIMSGVTSKSWSPNVQSSPLLGNEERRLLREKGTYLPTTKEDAEQKEALFRRLIQAGESLTIISRPLLDDEGRPVSESPFMQKFVDDMTDWKCEKLNSEGINILLGSDGYTFPKIDAGNSASSREVPHVSARAYSVAASNIQELLGCPFLWWQKNRAKLYQPDSELVSPAEWGNMLHKYWEFVWKNYRQDMTSSGTHFVSIAKQEWDRLAKADDEAYSKFSHLLNDGRLKRRLEGVKFRAERLAGVQGQILDALHAKYEHESILLEDEAQMYTVADGIKFLGQCDRIEILRKHDGSRFALIADYKEGRKKSSSYDEGMDDISGRTWNTEPERCEFKHGLQLSLYAALFGRNYDCTLSGVYILGHEDGCVFGTFGSDTAGIFAGLMPYNSKGEKVIPSTDIEGRKTEGEYAMQCAVRVLKSGDFAPEYSLGPCRYCHIKSLCRKGEFRGEIVDTDDADSEE